MGILEFVHSKGISISKLLQLIEWTRFRMEAGTFWVPLNNEIISVLGGSVGAASAIMQNNIFAVVYGLVPVLIINAYKFVMGYIDIKWIKSYQRRTSLGWRHNEFMQEIARKIDNIEAGVNGKTKGKVRAEQRADSENTRVEQNGQVDEGNSH